MGALSRVAVSPGSAAGGGSWIDRGRQRRRRALKIAEEELSRAPEESPGAWTVTKAEALAGVGRDNEAMTYASLVAYEGFTGAETKRARSLVQSLKAKGIGAKIPSQKRFRELFDHYFDIGLFPRPRDGSRSGRCPCRADRISPCVMRGV
ncbi:MAG: hypothetical protein M5R36_08290 [Deltaproteobacteria bacterium]|nr:hypothetical protein [Deltaproteobacteria bacterium]